MDLQQLRDSVKPLMDERRYRHTLSTEEVSYDLALIHGCDTMKASIAGILHDCAKNFSDENLMEECEKYRLPVSEVEKQRGILLHAKVGAAFAKDIFKIDDEDILKAIDSHTTGRPGMSLLEKIIFTADYIEPLRQPIPRIDEIRHMAYQNLDVAITMIAQNTLDYLNSTGEPIDTLTIETYEFYRALTLPHSKADRKALTNAD